VYGDRVPRLWNATIDEHRRTVHAAILDAAAALTAQHGLAGVTMSQIAAEVGIGRATLYKYFPDVEAILGAWHARQVSSHLHDLAELRDHSGAAGDRLARVLEAYALMQHSVAAAHGTELTALLHGGAHVQHAHDQLRDFIQDLVIEGAAAGELRDDVAPDELATFCLHVLSAAAALPSVAAVGRLVTVTLAGLRTPPRRSTS